MAFVFWTFLTLIYYTGFSFAAASLKEVPSERVCPFHPRTTPHLKLSDIFIESTPPEEGMEFHGDSFRTFSDFFSGLTLDPVLARDPNLFTVTPFSIVFEEEDLTEETVASLGLKPFSVPVGYRTSLYSLLAIDGKILQSILLIDKRPGVKAFPFKDLDMNHVNRRRQKFLRKCADTIQTIYSALLSRAMAPCKKDHYAPLSRVRHLALNDFSRLVEMHIDHRRIDEVQSLISAAGGAGGELDSTKKSILSNKVLHILESKVKTTDPLKIEAFRKTDCDMLKVLLPNINFDKNQFEIMLRILLKLSKKQYAQKVQEFKKEIGEEDLRLSPLPSGRASPGRRSRCMSVSDSETERAEYISAELSYFDRLTMKFASLCPASKLSMYCVIVSERRHRISNP